MSDSRVNKDRRMQRATKILTLIRERADLVRLEAELHAQRGDSAAVVASYVPSAGELA